MRKSYAEMLLDPRWQKKRLKILQRDKWMCSFCYDDTSTLHVHHKKYGPVPWEVDNKDLITVCHYCHSLIEIEKPDEVIAISQSGEWYTAISFTNKNSYAVVYYKKIKDGIKRYLSIDESSFNDDLKALNKAKRKHHGVSV